MKFTYEWESTPDGNITESETIPPDMPDAIQDEMGANLMHALEHGSVCLQMGLRPENASGLHFTVYDLGAGRRRAREAGSELTWAFTVEDGSRFHVVEHFWLERQAIGWHVRQDPGGEVK